MQSKEKGYYDIDIDIDEALVKMGMVDDIFYLRDLRQRKLFLTANIDQFSIGDITKHIMQYNAEDKGIPTDERKPILLYAPAIRCFSKSSSTSSSTTIAERAALTKYALGFISLSRSRFTMWRVCSVTGRCSIQWGGCRCRLRADRYDPCKQDTCLHNQSWLSVQHGISYRTCWS